MTKSRIFFLFPLLLLIVASRTVSAQTLPVKVKSYLENTYPGWKQSTMARDAGCFDAFRKLIVVGDFDGNGSDDYATRITHKRKGYFMAFLEQNGNYKPYILLSLSAAEIKNYGLNRADKGDEYTIGDPYDGGRPGRLPNDAPVIGPCESEAYPYVYRRGRFVLE